MGKTYGEMVELVESLDQEVIDAPRVRDAIHQHEQVYVDLLPILQRDKEILFALVQAKLSGPLVLETLKESIADIAIGREAAIEERLQAYNGALADLQDSLNAERFLQGAGEVVRVVGNRALDLAI